MDSGTVQGEMMENLKDIKKYQNQGKLRLTLSSCSVESIQNVVNGLQLRARDQAIKVVGPIRLPIKKLRITTRKTPCGEGSKTWDRFQMSIHKWVLDIYCKKEDIKQLLSIHFPDGVKIRVTVSNYD